MGFGKDGKGVIIVEQRSQAIGTLASNTGLIIGTKLATLERFRMLKATVLCMIESHTAGELGDLRLYLADGNLNLAQIEEALESLGPLGPNDTVTADRVERAVFYVGSINGDMIPANEAVNFVGEGNQPMMTIKPRWTFARTKSWNWVVYHRGPAPTTGASVRIDVKSFGVWVT